MRPLILRRLARGLLVGALVGCQYTVSFECVAPGWYADADGDGFGDPHRPLCEAADGYVAFDDAGAFDCDDGDAAVSPAAEEHCNGLDDDCDGGVDAGAWDLLRWYTDADGDGWGAGAPIEACEPPEGSSERAGDCDDADGATWPGADELCDGLDQDCDGVLDEQAIDRETFYEDVDGDGFGDPGAPVSACALPEGAAEDASDCDDGDDEVHPDAAEICGDGVDNDCDHSGAGCSPAGEIPLSQADAIYLGEGIEDGLGGSLSWVGDATGDGRPDLLMGAPTFSSDRDEAAGAVYLVSGFTPGEQDIGGAARWTVRGAVDGQNLGGLLAGAGDVDGDGLSDVLMGSWADQSGDNAVEDAHLVMAADVAPGSWSIDELPSITFTSSARSGEHLGATAGGPLDMEGDGLADILLGVWRPGDALTLSRGAAYVFPGDGLRTGDVVPLADAPYKLLGDDGGGDAVQLSVAAAGDLDGDGLGDVLAGDSKWNAPEGQDEGVVWLVSAAAMAEGEYALSDAAAARFVGPEPGSEIGRGVCGAGDVNGDGYGDVGIGSINWDAGFDDTGAVLVVYGPFPDAGWEADLESAAAILIGYEAELFAGRPLAPVGDVEGDGYGDLIAGSSLFGRAVDGEPGQAFLIRGPVEGVERLDRYEQVVTYAGAERGDWAGSFVAGPGDVNRDGFPDLLVGAALQGRAAPGAGAVYLLTAPGI